jgi:hypothetical protein
VFPQFIPPLSGSAPTARWRPAPGVLGLPQSRGDSFLEGAMRKITGTEFIYQLLPNEEWAICGSYLIISHPDRSLKIIDLSKTPAEERELRYFGEVPL